MINYLSLIFGGIKMKNKITPEKLAEYIISYLFYNKNMTISNLKLQKLLYFIQRDYIKFKKTPLFDEVFEAWQYGPVIRDVYFKYSKYGALPIIFDINENYNSIIDHTDLNQEDIEIINNTINHYSESDAWDMVDESHKKNGAWDNVYNNPSSNDLITYKDIEKYE